MLIGRSNALFKHFPTTTSYRLYFFNGNAHNKEERTKKGVEPHWSRLLPGITVYLQGIFIRNLTGIIDQQPGLQHS